MPKAHGFCNCRGGEIQEPRAHHRSPIDSCRDCRAVEAAVPAANRSPFRSSSFASGDSQTDLHQFPDAGFARPVRGGNLADARASSDGGTYGFAQPAGPPQCARRSSQNQARICVRILPSFVGPMSRCFRPWYGKWKSYGSRPSRCSSVACRSRGVAGSSAT